MSLKKLRIPVFLLLTAVIFLLFINGFLSGGNDEFPYAKAVTYVGKCGDEVKWTLNLKKGSLALSGIGGMNSFEEKETPWIKYKDNIKKIIIDDGVTLIGDNAFSYLDKVQSVSVSKSVEVIGTKSFYGCAGLKEINGSFSSLKKIGDSAFSYCRQLNKLPDFPSLECVGKNAFYYCYSLPLITLGYSVTEIGNGAFAYCEGLKKLRIVNYKCKISDDENTVYKNTLIEGFSESTAHTYCKKYSKKFSKIKDINYLNDLKIKLKYTTVIYDGEKKKPGVSIKGLKEGSDFIVKYSDNINPGTAKATVYAAGDTLGKKTIKFKILPSAVENVSLKSRGSDYISIKWDKVIGADKYEIFQRSADGWNKIGQTQKTSFKITNLHGGVEYSFRVRAVTLVGKTQLEGKFSKSYSDFTSPESPGIEKISLVRGGGKLRVAIKKISGVSGYEIYMSTEENGVYSKVSSIAAGGKLSVIVDNLSNSNTYYFKVRTYMKNGSSLVYSQFSDIKSSNVL